MTFYLIMDDFENMENLRESDGKYYKASVFQKKPFKR